jgi:CRISPR/Cas system-associated exonuclease Cas4 (RecB family)
MLRLASEDDSGWRPIRLELAFGLRERAGRDSASTPEPILLDCGVRLRGAIDAIEESRTGSLRITDFKSGKDRTKEGLVVGGGAVLQPVLYALAAEKLFPGQRVESGRLYYCTSAGEFSDTVVQLDARSRTAIGFVTDTVAQALESGFLPAAPSNKEACEWCDYLPVCGQGELNRTRRKPKDRLATLMKLREME